MTQAAALAAYGSNSPSNRNRIINGAMVIDQRNAGASVTNDSAELKFAVDRTNIYGAVSSKFTAQQNAGSVTPPAGFSNYLGCTSSSAYTVGANENFWVQQKIEGYNVADLNWGTANAKTVTLSFWVRSSLTGTFGGSFQNSASNRSYPFTYTINTANTWEQKTVTVVGDTSGTWLTTNGVGMNVTWGLGVGSTLTAAGGAWAAGSYWSANSAVNVIGTLNATFYITGVQLEVGTVATPFERRLYGQELMLCQRYYQRIGDGVTVLFSGYATSSSDFYQSYTLQTEMRTSPTATRVGTWTLSNTNTQPTFVATPKMFRVNSQITTTGTGWVQANTSAYVSFDAEL